IALSGGVTLSDAVTLSSGGGDIGLAGAVDSAAGGLHPLSLAAGAGSITVSGVVGTGPGSPGRLGSLRATGSSLELGSVHTAAEAGRDGAQVYSGSTGLSGSYTSAGGAFRVEGPAVLRDAV